MVLNMRFNFKKANKLVKASPFKRAYIAEELGIKLSSFNHYLGGYAIPGEATVKALAKILKVSVMSLYD